MPDIREPSERLRENWWRGAVIYQIYPRSFCDSDGDGIGDLPGISAKLDYVAGLGVDAIWLSPFFTSPMADFGYDVANYVDVDPIFGTLADFDQLIAKAHGLGLKVIIDQVWCHTSERHPWFLESRSSRLAEKADWYVWADPRSDGTPPTNWLSVFGGSAWRWEPRRRQFYLHHFLEQQPCLNLRNPIVLAAILDTGEFWLKRGVDGFRLDAVDWMTHDAELRDNPAQKLFDGKIPAQPFGMQRHEHDMLNPDTATILASIRALMDRYPGTATLGECSSEANAFERVISCTEGPHGLDMAYTLSVMEGDFNRAAVLNTIAEISQQGERGWIAWAFSNHDVERVASRWNPAGRDGPAPNPGFVKLLAAFLVSLRGTICVYQGEELGLGEAELALADIRDPFGIAYWPEFRGRDGSRTPMPWTDGANGGFTSAGKPWLPVPPQHLALAVSLQEADPQSVLSFWRRLLRWRQCCPAMIDGTLAAIDLPAPLVGFVRDRGGDGVTCLFNLSNQTVRATKPDGSDAAAAGFGPASIDSATGAVVLPPWGFLFVDGAAVTTYQIGP